MYALNINEYGRILSATYEQYAADGAPLVETLPDGDITDYIYKDGEYVYEPLPEPEPEHEDTTPVTWAALAAAYSEGVNEA